MSIATDALDKMDYQGINLDRLSICEDILKNVIKNDFPFSLHAWQNGCDFDSRALSPTELGYYKITACFGGFLAMDTRFIASGGGMMTDGSPVFVKNGLTHTYHSAFNVFVGLPPGHELAENIMCAAFYVGDDNEEIANPTAKDVLKYLQYVISIVVCRNELAKMTYPFQGSVRALPTPEKCYELVTEN